MAALSSLALPQTFPGNLTLTLSDMARSSSKLHRAYFKKRTLSHRDSEIHLVHPSAQPVPCPLLPQGASPSLRLSPLSGSLPNFTFLGHTALTSAGSSQRQDFSAVSHFHCSPLASLQDSVSCLNNEGQPPNPQYDLRTVLPRKVTKA